MVQIYSDAHLTIAALASSDVSGGCFRITLIMMLGIMSKYLYLAVGGPYKSDFFLGEWFISPTKKPSVNA
ncbi:hypothetical protein EJ02DRAFT_480349, partial [Clathrospora elynae]